MVRVHPAPPIYVWFHLMRDTPLTSTRARVAETDSSVGMCGVPPDEGLSALLSAAPTFRPEWLPSGATPDSGEAIGQLVEHLGAQAVRTDELRAVLRVAERYLRGADSPPAARLALGLIEDLQLLASFPDTSLRPEGVASLLPPACLTEWTRLDAKWRAEDASLTGEPPKQTVREYERVSDPRLRRLIRTTCRAMDDRRLLSVADVLQWEVRRQDR
jgi:hypothetical protein